ncbi:MAG TPA: halocarboxylic acid dehydrogenase DehI family protein [Actinomycetota bacterium]|nr:halocarboxylic acid dehydrogenase DehI family protein [Actinomycetota bacterium]
MADGRRRDLKLEEISENEASGDVAEIYERIKEVLQVNVVASVWRVFATKPKFLSAVWNALEPAIDRGFLEAADGIRALAIERVGEGQKVADHRSFLGGDLGRAVEEFGVFLETNPKTLILLCALRRSWTGQPIGGIREAAAADRGVPRWQAAPTFGNDRAVKEVFDEMEDLLDLPAPSPDYRVLAQWPDYLRAAWADLRSFIGNEAWQKACGTVEWVAEQIAVALPARIDVSSARANELGLGPAEADEVGTWINAFHDMLPGTIVNDSFLWIGMFGGRQELPAP